VKIVIPGGSGQGRCDPAALADCVGARRDRPQPHAQSRRDRLGRADGRRLGARTGGRRRGRQSRRPERELPLHAREPASDHGFARRVDGCGRPGDRRVQGASARVAPGEYRNDLRATATTRRTTRPPASSAAPSPTHPTRGGSASTSRGRGSTRSTSRRRRERARSRCASAMIMSPDRGGVVRRPARARASWPRRHARQWAAIRLVGARRRLRSCGPVSDRA